MKLSAKIFVVSAILLGVSLGSNPKDRARWLAALGMSRATATELRIENSRERFQAGRAAEQARTHDTGHAVVQGSAPQGTVMTVEDVCAAVGEKEAMLAAHGKAVDAQLQRFKLRCSSEGKRYAD